MLVGHVGRVEPHFIGGWAADTEAPDSVVDVIVYIDGKRASRLSCDVFREDLLDLKIYGEGSHGFASHISPPLPLHLLDRVTVRFARTGAALPDGDRPIRGAAALQAILVTAPGRSGTTVLMSRLSRSPQICIAEAHPFEVRQVSYWSTVVRTLGGEADYQRSMHPDQLEGDGFKVGANPFSHADYIDVFQTRELEAEYYRAYVPQLLQDLAHRMIEEYYLRLRDDQAKQEAIFFAEKSNNLDRQTREFARTLFPDLKEIVLIRDPRDLLCSHLSYFNRQPDAVTEEITEAAHELMRIKREESDRVLFVGYEAMILDAGTTTARIAAYLGVDSFDALDSDRERSAFEVHGTSASPKASIGRWRSQLSKKQRSWCNGRWSEFLSEFEYS
jgi:hypothetical protein